MLTVLLAAVVALPNSEDVFAGDERLNKPLTVRFEIVSARDVLAEIGKQTDTKLQIEPALSEDLIILFAEERPAREIMSLIAEHFDWTWRKSEGGYTLFRTAEQRKHEEEARRAQILQPYQSMRDQAKKLLHELREAGDAEIWKRAMKLDEAMQAANEAEEYSKLRQLSSARGQLELAMDPHGVMCLELIASLTDEQLLELDNRKRIVFSTSPTPAQHRMPATSLGLANRKKVSRFNAETGQFEVNEDAAVQRVVTVISLEWGVGLALNSEFYGGGRHLGSDSHTFTVADSEPADAKQRELPEVFRKRVAISSEIRMLFGPYVDPRPEWVLELMRSVRSLGSRVDPRWPNGIFAREIARMTELPVISSVYDISSPYLYELKIDASTPEAMVNLHCIREECDWDFKDGWIRMRHKRWALGRYATIPRSLLFTWRDRRIQQQGITLDQYGEITSRLNDKQLESLSRGLVLGDFIESFRDPRSIYCGRLWHALSPLQKTELANGEQISYRTMSPQQRFLYSEILLRGGARGEPEPYGDPLEERRIEWRRAVAHPTDSFYVARPGIEITDALPNGPGEQAALRVLIERGDALYVNYSHGVTAASLNSIASLYGSELFNRVVTSLKPAVWEVALFTLEPLPGILRGADVRTYSADTSSDFVEFKNLPERLKQRIQKLAEEFRIRHGG